MNAHAAPDPADPTLHAGFGGQVRELRARASTLAACVFGLVGSVLVPRLDGSPQASQDPVTRPESSPEAGLLAERGLTRSGRFYVVASEREFDKVWSRVGPLIISLQESWDAWSSAAEAEAQVRELDERRSELAAQIKTIRGQMANRDRLVRRWHQAELNVAESHLNEVKARLDDARTRQVRPAKLKALQDDFASRKAEFMAAADELGTLYKTLKDEYDALRRDDRIREAIRILKEKRKLNVTLGPSENVLNAVRRVDQVRKEVSPDAPAAQARKKRPRLQEKSKRPSGSPAPRQGPGP